MRFPVRAFVVPDIATKLGQRQFVWRDETGYCQSFLFQQLVLSLA